MMKKHLRIQNHQVIRKKIKGESCGTNLWKDTLHKEYINTQKVTNGPHFISQSEPLATKEIILNKL